MLLNNHRKNIIDCQSWFKTRPPKKGNAQWVDGRSAKELANYITKHLPSVPKEIENAVKPLVSQNTKFDWDAEYVTALPGQGEGRNHDAILFDDDIVITIEAKADEPLGNLIKDEMQKSSVNKLVRISALLNYIFKGNFAEYKNLRYQLLTASVGTILEAQKRNVSKAVLLILVFKTNGNISDKKLTENHQNIIDFLKATDAYDENGLMVIPNNTDVKLYFKEIVV